VAEHDGSKQSAEPARVLGLLDVVTIAIAAIIGVGIFFTPASVVERAGSGGMALLVWIIGGVLAVIGALTFAELGAMMPKVGGQFAVIREAFGRRVGFLSVASVTLTVQCGAIGILALICARNLLRGFGFEASRIQVTLGALAAVLFVWGINVAGVVVSARVLRANVALKLVMIAAIVALAAASQAPAPPDAFTTGRWPGVVVFFYSLIPTLFAFGGFEQILWAAGEVRDPGKNVARGILIGVGIVLVAYLATNVSFLSLLGAAGVARDRDLLTPRAVEAGASGFGFLAAFGVAISALGTTHAIMLTAPRQIVALARDGMAPRVFGALSTRTGAPVAATTFLAVVTVVMVVAAGLDGIDALLDAVICVNWIFFAVTAGALIALRRKRPDLPRPFRVPGYPVTPAVFGLAALSAAASPFFRPEGRFSALVAAGLLLTLGIASRLFIRDIGETKEQVAR
jgi:APA family basic amino acid/polyamine antiporter